MIAIIGEKMGIEPVLRAAILNREVREDFNERLHLSKHRKKVRECIMCLSE